MDKTTRKTIVLEHEDKSWPELADTIHSLRVAKDELAKQTKAINAELEIICREIIPERMAEEGLRGVPLTDGSRLELRSKAFCSTRAGMRDALMAWFRDHDLPEMVTETINASTLKAFMAEQLKEGNEVPPDELLSYTPFVEATLVGRK